MADGGVRLVHGDLYLAGQRLGCGGGFSEALRQRLDQPDRRSGHDGGEPVGQRRVVRGQFQVVGGRGGRGVQPEHRVHDELLAVLPLGVQHAVIAEDAQPAERDPVRGWLGIVRAWRGAVGAHPLAPAAWLGPVTPAGLESGELGCAACRQASATRTASALAGTRCTRAHHAPATAARAVTDTVASSLPTNGRGVPSGAASSLPRNRLRDAPISTGNPGARPPSVLIWSRLVSSAQLCSGRLAKPSPGSSTIMAGSTPCAVTTSTRRHNSSATSRTTSWYTALESMLWLWPRQCITTYGTPAAPTSRGISGSARPPLTSLTSRAPAPRACSATSARIVSTLTGTPPAARPWMTGPARRNSSSAVIR